MTARWQATIYYHTDHGLADVAYDIEELDELADLVEFGPDWNTIKVIKIELNPKRRTHKKLTVEESEKL